MTEREEALREAWARVELAQRKFVSLLDGTPAELTPYEAQLEWRRQSSTAGTCVRDFDDEDGLDLNWCKTHGRTFLPGEPKCRKFAMSLDEHALERAYLRVVDQRPPYVEVIFRDATVPVEAWRRKFLREIARAYEAITNETRK
jgi:hypothetical protein